MTTPEDKVLREYCERVLQKTYENTWDLPGTRHQHLLLMLMREIKAGYQRGREDERRELLTALAPSARWEDLDHGTNDVEELRRLFRERLRGEE